MIGQHGPTGGGSLDLAAVARDAALLDLLAARAPEPADDGVAALLSALAAEVDDGLETWRRDRVDAGAAQEVPAQRLPALREVARAEPSTRRHSLRVSTVALVLGATLSVGGVAAAVTGDPLAAYHGIVHAVAGQTSDQPAPVLSPHAARIASLRHLLNGTRARLAHGDVAGAQRDIDRLRRALAGIPDLTAGERTAFEARIAVLEASLARASAEADARTAHAKGRAGEHNRRVATPDPQRTGTASSHRPTAHATKAPSTRHVATPQRSKAPPTHAPAGGSAQQAPAPTAAPATAPQGNGNGKAAAGGAAAGSQSTKDAKH